MLWEKLTPTLTSMKKNIDKNDFFSDTSSSSTDNTNTVTSGTSSNSTESSGTVIHCPAFDAVNCKPQCMGLDTNGCLTCSCGPEGLIFRYTNPELRPFFVHYQMENIIFRIKI